MYEPVPPDGDAVHVADAPVRIVVGETTHDAVSTGTFTVSEKVEILESPPPVPVIVIVETPAGVEESVAMVSVEEHVGLQEVGENDAVAPVGSPVAENVTAWVVPLLSEAVAEFVTELPCVTDLAPPFAMEKSKGGAFTVSEFEHALVTVWVPEVTVTEAVLMPVSG